MNKHIIANDKSMIRLLGVAIVAIVMMGVVPHGHTAPIVYLATLNGAGESPPNASPGTGFAEVDFDLAAHTMFVHVVFSDLLAGTTASHIHSPTAVPGTGTAGVATTVPTFTAFPLGVTSGTYDRLFDMSSASSYNPAFVTASGGTVPGAEAALAASLAAGTAYLNIHTTEFPGGEIRGFLTVPEPASLLLFGLGWIALAGVRRCRK